MIKFRCLHCRQKLTAPVKQAGKKSRCPRCKEPLVVPFPDAAKPPAATADSDAAQTQPAAARHALTFLDVAQEERIADDFSDQHDPAYLAAGAPTVCPPTEEQQDQPTGERVYPWPVDLLLYPASKPCIGVLAIIIGLPLLINLAGGLLGPFGVFIFIPGLIINIVLMMYLWWYWVECVRDSARGGIRAPEVIATTPGLGEMFWSMLRTLTCLGFFLLPMLVYWLNTRRTDTLFWALLAYAVVLLPMGLLAVIMFDSLYGLNPLLIVGSLFSTLLPYIGLTLLFGLVAFLIVQMISLRVERPVLGFALYIVRIYLQLIAAHLLGRFFWRYEEKLNWAA